MAHACLDFLRGVFEGCGNNRITFRISPSNEVHHLSFDQLDEAQRILEHNHNQNIYFGIATRSDAVDPSRSGTESQITGLCGFFLELDFDSGTSKNGKSYAPSLEAILIILDASPVKPSILIHSGHGVHACFLLDRFLPLESSTDRTGAKKAWRSIQTYFEKAFGEFGWEIDTCSDLTRMMRMPGSMNVKAEPLPVTILDCDFTRRYTMTDLSEIMLQQKPVRSLSLREADAEKIFDGCGFMAHARDNAATLSEPEWKATLDVVSYCANGEVIAQEISKPHPDYDSEQTSRKFEGSKRAPAPRGCSSISAITAGKFCDTCNLKGRVRSPVDIGLPKGQRASSNEKEARLKIRDIASILSSDDWEGIIGYDTMRRNIVLRSAPPFDGLECKDPKAGEWTDTDDTRLEVWLQRNHGRADQRGIRAAVDLVAQNNQFNPVRDFLEGLKWDGILRLSSWMSKYLGVDDTEYSRLVSQWALIAAVARVMKPGSKVDHVVVLEGHQGAKKSTAISTLFSPEFYADTSIRLSSKDSMEVLLGVWCYEFSEFDTYDSRLMKAFVSSQSDRFRLPYARRSVPHERCTVFFGTTNKSIYLQDQTGGRRFLSVWCNEIDLRGLESVREQLFAEAIFNYQRGNVWYPQTAEETALCRNEQELRLMRDPMEEKIADYLRDRIVTTISKIASDVLKQPEGLGVPKSLEMQLSEILTSRMDWANARYPVNGSKKTIYLAPGTNRNDPAVGDEVKKLLGASAEVSRLPSGIPQKPQTRTIEVNRRSETDYAAI